MTENEPKAETPISKDTPEQALLRERLTEELRQERGDRWVEEHKGMLDDQWEWARQLGLI